MARHRTSSAAQTELFGAPAIPGLRCGDDIVSPDEELDLIARIDAVGLSPFRFRQWEGGRLTKSYGWHYDFTSGRMSPAEPMPAWLGTLRTRAAAFAGLAHAELEQALLIRYDPGAGIGWHRDRPVFEHVVGISLGAPATMRFRRRRDGKFLRANVPLAPRGVYHLAGEVRHEWEHSIAPQDMARWSITFRSRSA